MRSGDFPPKACVLVSPNSAKIDTDVTSNNINGTPEVENPTKRFLQCPGMCRVDVLKKFVLNKYNVDPSKFQVSVGVYKRVWFEVMFVFCRLIFCTSGCRFRTISP